MHTDIFVPGNKCLNACYVWNGFVYPVRLILTTFKYIFFWKISCSHNKWKLTHCRSITYFPSILFLHVLLFLPYSCTMLAFIAIFFLTIFSNWLLYKSILCLYWWPYSQIPVTGNNTPHNKIARDIMFMTHPSVSPVFN